MTKIKLYVLSTLVVFCFSALQAQNEQLLNQDYLTDTAELMSSNEQRTTPVQALKTETDEQNVIIAEAVETPVELHYSGKWMIGAGINMVEDSGEQQFGDFFTFKHKKGLFVSNYYYM